MAGKGVGALLLFMVVGGLVGTILGEILGSIIGSSGIGLLFSRGVEFGLNEPMRVDLRILTFTFGLSFKLTLLSVLGLLFGVYLSRKF